MEEYIKIFNDYYKKFDDSLWGVSYKYDHTFRVVDFAEQIAKSLKLSDEDIEFAKVCALFHDIARFKQWQDYNTFHDSISFDHGDMGYTILKELGIDDEIILLSTKYHNKYSVPEDLDDRTKLFANITRDADKLDIMIEQDRVCNDEELSIDDEIIDAFNNRALTHNKKTTVYSDADKIFRNVSFIFDINFKKSMEIIKEKDLVNSKLDSILAKFDDERVRNIKDICNKYINERISD